MSAAVRRLVLHRLRRMPSKRIICIEMMALPLLNARETWLAASLSLKNVRCGACIERTESKSSSSCYESEISL